MHSSRNGIWVSFNSRNSRQSRLRRQEHRSALSSRIPHRMSQAINFVRPIPIMMNAVKNESGEDLVIDLTEVDIKVDPPLSSYTSVVASYASSDNRTDNFLLGMLGESSENDRHRPQPQQQPSMVLPMQKNTRNNSKTIFCI